MYKKIFVLLIVLIFVTSLYMLFRYDQKVLENREANEQKTKDNIEQERAEDETLEDDYLGYLVIEKIGLNGQVKEGSTNDILKEYIGHIEETAKYDGNVALAAHNRGNEYSYFARINVMVLPRVAITTAAIKISVASFLYLGFSSGCAFIYL